MPVAGHRHAFRLSAKATEVGQQLTSLCSVNFLRPNIPSDMQWLWKTCETCWFETCILAGLRVRGNKKSPPDRKTD
jgi:hypothetical protein